MIEHTRGDGVENALTPIPMRIHSGATEEQVELVQREAFIDTLAEVAMSIANRSAADGNPEA